MDKASGAYRTISEVAEELDIPQHVLRFWETRFPQIKPMKRSGGRRYYRPGDVLLLRGIRKLLYGEGYTIKGVQRILVAQGVGIVQQAGGASGEEVAASAEAEDYAVATAPGDADHDDEAASFEIEPEEEHGYAPHSPLGEAPVPRGRDAGTSPLEREPTFAHPPQAAPQMSSPQMSAPLSAAPGHSPQASPRVISPDPVAPLSSLNRQLLQGVLAELTECARHLDRLKETASESGASPANA